MPFNIQEFRSRLPLGGARANLFEVELVPPAILTGLRAAAQQFQFLCHSAQVPESSITPITLNYFGRDFQVAGDRTYSGTSEFTFHNDENYAIKNMLELWMSALNQHVANVRTVGRSDQYEVPITVKQYGKAGNLIREYVLMNAYPSAVGATSLSWDENQEIQDTAVTFTYSWWWSKSTDQSTPPINQ